MLTEEQLIKQCRKFKASAQRELYERYVVDFKVICLRYVRFDAEADDILQESFMKIFQNIKSFKGEGSFEGWMKRIVVNTAISHYNKEKRTQSTLSIGDFENSPSLGEEVEEDVAIDRKDVDEKNIDFTIVEQADISKKELLDCVSGLKDDFKMVFNLYFLENYKHKEIAETLNIEEKTSRTRLNRARSYIKQALFKKSVDKVSV